jgi:hypothetical protein
LIVRITGQIVDLELHRAANTGTDRGRKSLEFSRIATGIDPPDALWRAR